jgi:hypothetical protein
MAEESSERRFGAQEMRKILALAAHIQSREGEPEGRGGTAESGFSLAELQQAAAEVGIQPHHVAAALRELEQGRAARVPLLGAPDAWEIERTVEGEVSEADWEEVVAAIRQKFGHGGTATPLGSALDWQSRARWASVTVSPRGGRTRIRVSLRPAEILFAPYLIVFIYALVGVGAAMGGLHLPLPAELAIAAGIMGGALGATRQIIQGWFRRRTRAAHELAERLAGVVTKAASQAPEPLAVAEQPATSPVGEALHAGQSRS